MSSPYVPPTFQATAFNCPYCNAFASQMWQHLYLLFQADNPMEAGSRQFWMSWCSHCKKLSAWHDQRLVVPDTTDAPMPHVDIPNSCQADFEEARAVLQRSPRSAAALLRLCLQKLCVELGESGKNINDDIGHLVSKGLPVQVQQALDIVRVVGNEQVHPGELDVRDNPAIAKELFELVNFIIEDRITRPRKIEALYAKLPATKRQGIEQRDS